MATPYFATEYTVAAMNLDPSSAAQHHDLLLRIRTYDVYRKKFTAKIKRRRGKIYSGLDQSLKLQCRVSPQIRLTACCRTGLMTSKHSRTPFGEPGRLIIKVLLRIPQTPRESIANGVFFIVSKRIASANPLCFFFDHGARRFGRVVARRKTRAARRDDQIYVFAFGQIKSVSRKFSKSSVTILRSTISAPMSLSNSINSSPDASFSKFLESLTVTTQPEFFYSLYFNVIQT